MTGNRETVVGSTPWHLWVVGVVSLLWNGMGAVDYVMTETRNAEYMKQFTEAQREYFESFPSWVVCFWALAVWGGALGSVLLLARRRLAAPVFLASLGAMVVTTLYNFVLSDGLEIMGPVGVGFSALIFVLAVLFCVYARAMAARGVLR